MKNFLLNPCGDIAIENGGLVPVEGGDHIRQCWLIRVRTYLGEWFLDASRGVPYTQEIFEKNVTEKRLKDIFREVTLKTPGITRVNQVTIGDIDAATRSVSVTVDAIMESGAAGLFTYSGPLDPSNCPISPASSYPATLGDLRIWFDAQDLSTITYDPGVSLVLTNKAGPGTATGAGTSIPTFVGAGPINNKRSISLALSSAQYLDIADTKAIRGVSGAVTIVLVNGPQTTIDLWSGMLALTGVRPATYQKDFIDAQVSKPVNMNLRIYTWQSGFKTGSAVTADPNVAHISAYRINADQSGDIFYNGTKYSAGGAGSFYSVECDGGGRWGCSLQSDGVTCQRYTTGHVGEVLVYAGAVSDANLTALHAFLAAKWGF